MTERVVDMTMGVYRRIYAGYISGRKINGVSVGAEAWFWRLNVVADDFGNYRADEDHLVYAVGGRRVVTVAEVRGWMSELVRADLIFLYAIGTDKFFHINNFEIRQPAGKNGRRIRRYPEYVPGESGQIRPNPGVVEKSGGEVASETITTTETNTSTSTNAGDAAAAGVLNGNAEWLTKRPEWLPEGKPWIDRKTADSLARLRLEPDVVADVYKRAKARRGTLANPAGYVIAEMRKEGKAK